MQDHSAFDAVCLATALHCLANLRGAPNLHATIVQAPEFLQLKQLIVDRRAEFSARNIANTLWSLAKMNHNPGELGAAKRCIPLLWLRSPTAPPLLT